MRFSLPLYAIQYPSEQLVDEEIAHAGKAVRIFEIDVEYLRGKEIQER